MGIDSYAQHAVISFRDAAKETFYLRGIMDRGGVLAGYPADSLRAGKSLRDSTDAVGLLYSSAGYAICGKSSASGAQLDELWKSEGDRAKWKFDIM